jgi:hypothetical protein
MFSIDTAFAKKKNKKTMNSRFHLPLRIYFFLGAVRVHVVELVLLMPVTDRICVDVMGVADIGADSHLVSQGRLNSS